MSDFGQTPLEDNGALDDGAFGLSTPGVQSFHRALQAALHSGIAMDLGHVARPKSSDVAIPSGRLTLSKLQSLQAASQNRSPNLASQSDHPLNPSGILAEAFGEFADALPQKYVNGFSVYAVTGRTDLVLDSMSINLRADWELARLARPSLTYLAILVLTGILGSGVLAIVLQVIDDLRNDLLLLPHSMAISSDTKPWITQSQVSMLPWIALALLLVVTACLLPPVSAWMAKCLGGFGYLSSQRSAIAARIEHALVRSGVEGADAEQTAMRLVGSRSTQKRTLRTVSRNDQSQSDLQRLGLEAKHYQAWSNTRLRQLRFGLPMLLVMVLGSAGVLIYSLALFVPLTNLLHELSAMSVDPVMKWDKR